MTFLCESAAIYITLNVEILQENASVHIVVGKTFDDMVLSSSQNVLLEVSARPLWLRCFHILPFVVVVAI